MNIIKYRCLNGFHLRFSKADSKPELHKLNAFINMMQDDYSGENLISKIIDSDMYWEQMLNTKGFGRGKKYDKAQTYRKELIIVWNNILETFNSNIESQISKLIGLLLWDLKEQEFKHSYLGVLEVAIKKNKLWNKPFASEIFCSYFSFVQCDYKSLDEIAKSNNVTKERVRQLKDEYIGSFEQDFWFIKDDLIKEKLELLFDFNTFNADQLSNKTKQVNEIENVNFTQEFYTYIFSLAFDLELVGNINDIKNQNKLSSKGNVWSNLYLQTQEEKKRCDLENLINVIAIEMYEHNYHFEEDKLIDLKLDTALNQNEIERYKLILSAELECEIELYSDKVIIKRNSMITQPEMVENALKALGGFAYASDILEKVSKIYPEKNWTMTILRTSIRGDNFYTVGKNGLFGLKNMKDFREEMGNGTVNEIIKIYMSRNNSPVHYYDLLMHINNLFPRPKTLKSVHSFLEQNSKRYFNKFSGGFYGLSGKTYEKTIFKRVVGVHGTYLKKIIEESNGIGFEEVFKKFNGQYGLLKIQVKYLLYLLIESSRISLKDELYHPYLTTEISETYEILPDDEIDVELDQEELDYDELNQPEIPNELIKDYLAQIKIRRGQPRFRQKLLKLYRKTCIVTGCKIIDLLEAAHLFPHSNKNDYSLSNGILLRADIHTLFDLGLIAINPENMLLELNIILKDSDDYKKLNNLDISSKLLKLNPKYKLNEQGLRWRWENFIEFE